MTVQKALEEAMHYETATGVMDSLVQQGVWMADEDTMTAAIHNVYCGIMADHDQPNQKDRDQARQMIAAIGQQIGAGAGSVGWDKTWVDGHLNLHGHTAPLREAMTRGPHDGGLDRAEPLARPDGRLDRHELIAGGRPS